MPKHNTNSTNSLKNTPTAQKQVSKKNIPDGQENGLGGNSTEHKETKKKKKPVPLDTGYADANANSGPDSNRTVFDDLPITGAYYINFNDTDSKIVEEALNPRLPEGSSDDEKEEGTVPSTTVKKNKGSSNKRGQGKPSDWWLRKLPQNQPEMPSGHSESSGTTGGHTSAHLKRSGTHNNQTRTTGK